MLIVPTRAVLHPSTSDARAHLTLKLFTSTGWANDPKEAQATIHVYCNNNKVEAGYSGYKIHDTHNNKLNSASMRLRIKEALDKPFGKWAAASIAGFPSEHD